MKNNKEKMENKSYETAFSEVAGAYASQSKNISTNGRYMIYAMLAALGGFAFSSSSACALNGWLCACFIGCIFFLLFDFLQYCYGTVVYHRRLVKLLDNETEGYLEYHKKCMDEHAKILYVFFCVKMFALPLVAICFVVGVILRYAYCV